PVRADSGVPWRLVQNKNRWTTTNIYWGTCDTPYLGLWSVQPPESDHLLHIPRRRLAGRTGNDRSFDNYWPRNIRALERISLEERRFRHLSSIQRNSTRVNRL